MTDAKEHNAWVNSLKQEIEWEPLLDFIEKLKEPEPMDLHAKLQELFKRIQDIDTSHVSQKELDELKDLNAEAEKLMAEIEQTS